MRNQSFLNVAAALLSASGIAGAAERPAFSVEATPYTKYIWRGAVITNGPVVQTSTTAEYRGAHINVFTNQDLNRVNGVRGKVNELDFDAGYDYQREQEHITLSGGVIRYTYPNTAYLSTTEIYTGLSASVPLHPSVRAYFDVGTVRGTYITFDVFHGVALPRLSSRVGWRAAVTAGAGCGSSRHNAAYYGVAQSALADLHPAASLTFIFGRVELTPKLGYSMLLDPALRRGPGHRAHGFYSGVSLLLTL